MLPLVIPCPNRVKCPGSDNPFANLTMEAADSEIFIGSNFGINLQPPVGWNWRNRRGFAFCGSNISQSDADGCARHNAVIDQVDTPAGGDGGDWTMPDGTPAKIYDSTTQVCAAFCPDGLPFAYQVAAGAFNNIVQADADAAAQSYACTLAAVNKMCFGDFTKSACIGQGYDSVMDISGRGPFIVTVVGGQLPPGLALSQVSTPTSANAIELQGTPVISGAYSFSLRAVNPAGNSMLKTFTVTVWGFSSPGTLTPFTVGSPYTYQLVGEGGTSPYTFAPATPSDVAALSANSLTLGTDGLISGTPTKTDTVIFSGSITDSTGLKCTKQFTIQWHPAGINFNDLTWVTTTQDPGIPPGTATITANQNSFHARCVNSTPTVSNAIVDFTGTFSYTGPAVVGTGTVSAVPVLFHSNGAEITVKQDGVVLSVAGWPPDFGGAGGNFVGTFNIADTAGIPSVITIRVFLVGSDPNSGIDMSGVFTPAF